MNYKIPIIEKLYEAYSAIADNRVCFYEDRFLSDSSNYTKTYTIIKTEDSYISNDNASFWTATIGYPILAVMMLNKELPYNEIIIPFFKDINWKKLNTENNNDYHKVANEVLQNMKDNGVDINFIVQETEKTYSVVKTLSLPYKKSSINPPTKLIKR